MTIKKNNCMANMVAGKLINEGNRLTIAGLEWIEKSSFETITTMCDHCEKPIIYDKWQLIGDSLKEAASKRGALVKKNLCPECYKLSKATYLRKCKLAHDIESEVIGDDNGK